MEILLSLFLNPIIIFVIGFILTLGFLVSPYEIHFEEEKELDI